MAKRVLDHPDFERARPVAACARSPSVAHRSPTSCSTACGEKLPHVSGGLAKTYGLSESGGFLTLARAGDLADRPGTTGRPYPIVEIRIADPDDDGRRRDPRALAHGHARLPRRRRRHGRRRRLAAHRRCRPLRGRAPLRHRTVEGRGDPGRRERRLSARRGRADAPPRRAGGRRLGHPARRPRRGARGDGRRGGPGRPHGRRPPRPRRAEPRLLRGPDSLADQRPSRCRPSRRARSTSRPCGATTSITAGRDRVLTPAGRADGPPGGVPPRHRRLERPELARALLGELPGRRRRRDRAHPRARQATPTTTSWRGSCAWRTTAASTTSACRARLGADSHVLRVGPLSAEVLDPFRHAAVRARRQRRPASASRSTGPARSRRSSRTATSRPQARGSPTI